MESSILLAEEEEEEDGTEMETVSTQLNNPMITTWSMYTQCSDTDRRTYVTSVTLPAIQKRKIVEHQYQSTNRTIVSW